MSTLRLFIAVFLAEIFLVGPALAAVGSWNGVAFTHWNGVAQTSWNGTSISCAAGGGATATDTFNRTDANPISSPMSDGVSTWESGPGSLNDIQIVSNRARNTTSNSLARASAPTFAANQLATITLAGVAGTGAAVRIDGSGNGYVAYVASTTSVQLYRVTSGSFIAIGAAITVTALSSGNTVGLGIVGTTLTLYRDAVLVDTRTEATYATGQPGVFSDAAGGTMESFIAIDL